MGVSGTSDFLNLVSALLNSAPGCRGDAPTARTLGRRRHGVCSCLGPVRFLMGSRVFFGGRHVVHYAAFLVLCFGRHWARMRSMTKSNSSRAAVIPMRPVPSVL